MLKKLWIYIYLFSWKLNGFVEKKMDSEVKLVGDVKESSQAMGMSNFLKQIKEQQLQKGLKNEKNIKDEAGEEMHHSHRTLTF